MNNSLENKYIPDYLVTPGEILEEYLEHLNMTQVELAERTGLSKKTINEIIKGKSPITPTTALKFERCLLRPAHFWSNLERGYQDDKARLSEKERLESDHAWLEELPVKEMCKLGWIRKESDKSDQLNEILCFFGVASPKQWKTFWSKNPAIQYRNSAARKHSIEATAAWLRKGEIEAQKVKCPDYNRTLFLAQLERIRELTVETPESFVPKLVKLCAAAGVIILFVPGLPRTGIYGATRWIKGRPIMQLSHYRRSNDQLWFTIFHEAAHILLHSRNRLYIETPEMESNADEEEQANQFAKDKLIDPEQWSHFLKRSQPTLEEVKAFAESIGIAPGIVVDRLQHEKVIPMSNGNKLKVHYDVSEFESAAAGSTTIP